MSIKMKKSDLASSAQSGHAYAVVTLILGSVLVGLGACQMDIPYGLDISTPSTGVDTGPVWMGGDGSAHIPVTDVILSDTSISVMVGDYISVSADVRPANATNRRVVWTYEGGEVGVIDTVSADGLTVGGRCTSVGTMVIHATVDGVSATCTVTVQVKNIPVSSVTVAPKTLDLYLGDTSTLTADVQPANAANRTVVWSSDDPRVATVDRATGLVTGVTAGTAEITATAGGISDTCTVTVQVNNIPVSSITLSDTSLSVGLGTSFSVSADVRPANATNRGVVWTYNGVTLASFDPAGLTVSGKGGTTQGEGIITATAADGSGIDATCAVKVGRP